MTKPVSLNRVGSGYLWRFWFIAIAAWALQLFICYALVEWHCARPSTFSEQTLQWIVGIVTAVCFVAALVNLRYAFRYYRQLKKQKSSHSREIFMSSGACIMSGFLAAVILMQGWPTLLLAACSSAGG
jgi:divalent metal cation (Fe/Co/Zn/Cd) transporter